MTRGSGGWNFLNPKSTRGNEAPSPTQPVNRRDVTALAPRCWGRPRRHPSRTGTHAGMFVHRRMHTHARTHRRAHTHVQFVAQAASLGGEKKSDAHTHSPKLTPGPVTREEFSRVIKLDGCPGMQGDSPGGALKGTQGVKQAWESW